MKLRFLTLILAAALLCPLLGGCAKDNVDDVIAPREAERVSNVYRSEFLTLPENSYLNSNGLTVTNGRVYANCSRNVGTEEEYKEEFFIYSFDFGGLNPEEKIIEPVSEGANVNYISTDADGNVYMVEFTFDKETYSQTYILHKLAPDGTVLYSVDPSTYFPIVEGGDMYGGFYVQYMAVTAEGEVVITAEQSAAVIASDGTKLFDLTFENWIDGIGTTNDGRVYINSYDSNINGVTCRFIDIEGRKLGDSLEIPESVKLNGSNCSAMPGEGYDVYIRDSGAVYGYNNADAEPTKLLDFINSDIAPDGIQSFFVVDADHFIYSGYDTVTYESVFVFLTRIPDEEVEPKLLINLSYIYSDYMLTSYVVKFNQTNDTYRVVLHDYSTLNTDENYELGGQTLTNEIIAGNVPDILSIRDYAPGLDSASLTEKGLFCDLYEFIDADPDLTRDDLLKCVRAPFENDGKLTKLVTSFSVNTIVGKVANIGSSPTWTTEQMLALSDSLPEGTTLFGGEFMTKSYMLNNILSAGYAEFIDEAALTCSFDSETFIKLLEYCNTFPAEYDYESYEYDQNADQYISYREDKCILNTAYIASFSDYLQTRFQFGFEPINLIGYPTDTGSGSRIEPTAAYAITSRSPVKEGAWEFLSYLISDEVLTGDMSMRGMHNWPATVKALDMMAENESKNYYFFHYSGGWSAGTEPFRDEQREMMGMNDEEGLEGHLEQSDIDAVKAFLDTLVAAESIDAKVLSIITEEVLPYFNGDKTAADCAKVIQSKVSTYINEIS